MWPLCQKYHVAALTYSSIEKANLSEHAEGEPKKLWDQLAPAQKASLKRVAYEMRKGDIIYVKEGKEIVGKGTVLGSYKYDTRNRIIDPNGYAWNHQVPVDWQPDFPPIKILLGAEQFTVRPLAQEQVEILERRVALTREAIHRLEVTEGQLHRTEVTFRKRNRTIIEAKKKLSDGSCEVCGFRFADAYGIKTLCLVAHHMKPIGRRKRASTTSLEEIALLCPNCHTVAHTAEPPLSTEAIRKMLRKP